MKTYEEINNQLKCLPAIMALHNSYKKKATQAEKLLLGSIINDNYLDPYLLEFDATKKSIKIGHEYNQETKKYYRVSCFVVFLSFRFIS